MERLDIKTILDQYENSGVQEDGIYTKYNFSNKKGDYLEIIVFDDGKQLRFIDDNYPLPRRFFNTDLPYSSLEDFENDLKRMKIEIPKRKIDENLIVDVMDSLRSYHIDMNMQSEEHDLRTLAKELIESSNNR